MAFVFAGINVNAQQRRGMQKERGERRLEQRKLNQKQRIESLLDLSEEQKASMKSLRLQQQEKSLQHRNILGEKRARLQTLRSEKKADLKSINKLIDEMADLRAKQMKSSIAHEQEVRALLNDEQRVIFDSHKQNRKFRKGGERAQRGERGMRGRRHN